MLLRTLVTVLAVCSLLGLSSARRPRQRKQQKKTENLAIIERLDELEERLDNGETDGACRSNVHFFFHDGRHDHDHHDDDHDDDDEHVHVHLHHDGPHGQPFGGMPGGPILQPPPGGVHKALCVFDNPENGIAGHAHFEQGYMDKYARVRFHFHFLGEPGEVIPVHVHKYGDISHNCGTIGGHYDPYIEDRDVGDLGVLVVESDGSLSDTWKNETELTLLPPYTIIGRSMAIHNETSIISCCVIGLGAIEGDESIQVPGVHDHAHPHGHAHGQGRKHKRGPQPDRRPFKMIKT